MRVTKNTGARKEQWSGSLDKRNIMKGLHLTFQIGMLNPEVYQPGKIGKKFHLLVLKKKVGQEKQTLLNPV